MFQACDPANASRCIPAAIAIEYANRYMQSTFCSWYATGGEIPGLLQSLPGDARSGNAEDNGHMFEKFNG